MARPRKANELKTAHYTKTQQVEQSEVQDKIIGMSAESLKNPPDWLIDERAVTEWFELSEKLKCLPVISDLDYNNLGLYCNAYSSYVAVTESLKNAPMLVPYTNKAGNENLVENPLVKLQIKYSDEMKKYSSLLGLSIDSRLKIAQLHVQKQENEIFDDFGDI